MSAMLAAIATSEEPKLPPPAALQPSAAWQQQLLADFTVLHRQVTAMRAATVAVTPQWSFPYVGDVTGWGAWCIGRESRHPTLPMLAALGQPQASALLCGLLQSLTNEPRDDSPTPRLSLWLFAALAAIERDGALDADVAATVRALYSACVDLREALAASVRGSEAAGSWALLPAGIQERAVAINMLLTLSGGFFHQAPREEWQGGQ